MDQYCPQANCSIYINKIKVEVPTALKPSYSSYFEMPRLLVTSTKKRRYIIIGHLKSRVNVKVFVYKIRPGFI